MEYFSFKKGKRHQDKAPKPEKPVLDDEDEEFLKRITAQIEGTPPALPERPHEYPVAGDTEENDMQLVVADEAREVPIPDVADTPEGTTPQIDTPQADIPKEEASDGKSKGKSRSKSKEKDKDKPKEKKDPFAFFRRGSKAVRRKSSSGEKEKKRKGSDAKADEEAVEKTEQQKEEEEMEQVLDQLNLAAVNNRAFSFSKESQELLQKFTLVFKDLVNGVPTAYHDLESLLTNSEDQLQTMFKGMPSFIQNLVEKLPEKFTSHLGPETLAALSEKAKLGGKAVGAPAVKLRVPSLKELVLKRGALVTMLKSIMNFLKLRFPAVLGVNVLWSLALFLLLLICWYCHKRGKEVRLEKERQITEAEMDEIRKEVEADTPSQYLGPTTTTAPEGAPIEDVRAGLLPVEEVRDGDNPAGYAEGGSLAKAITGEKGAEQAAQKEEATGVEKKVAAEPSTA